MFLVLDSTLSFLVGSYLIVDELYLLGLLLGSVDGQLVVRNLVVQEVQGGDHQVVLGVVVVVFGALVRPSLSRGLLLVAVKVQYGFALALVCHITLALRKFRELLMNFPLFCRLNRVNEHAVRVHAVVHLLFSQFIVLLDFVLSLQDKLGVQCWGVLISTTAVA